MVAVGKEASFQFHSFGRQNVAEHLMIGSSGELGSRMEEIRQHMLATSPSDIPRATRQLIVDIELLAYYNTELWQVLNSLVGKISLVR